MLVRMPTYSKIRAGMQPPPIRATQFILAALALGVVCFSGVAAYLRFSGVLTTHAEIADLLPLVAAGLIVSCAPVYFLLRARAIVRVAADKDAALELVRADRIPAPLHQLAIVGAALVEGPGILAVLAVLLGANLYALAVPALTVLVICALIPSRSRIEDLVRDARAV